MKTNAGIFIIAEMACAHEGNPDLAHHLVEIAAEANPDAVQLQIFSVERLISPLASNFEMGKKLEISLSDWSSIINTAKQKKIDIWANVFDEDGLEFALSEGVDAIKLHSSDLSNPRMLDAAGISGKLISIAVGGSTIDEISQALSHLNRRGAKEILLMHGYQGYPTELTDARLGYIKTLEKLFGYPVGYQDHTDGGSEMALLLPLVAIGAGAKAVEKHYTDDRSRKGIDYEAALDPKDLQKFVAMVRSIDPAIGDGTLQRMSEAEQKYRHTMKKKLVAGRDLQKGEIINDEDILFLRADSGLTTGEYQNIVGQYCLTDIQQYSPIHNFQISNKP
jgi:sialic acid synthase SpsE